MYKFIILTIISLLFIGCNKTIRKEQRSSLTENILKEIVIKAINGERIYNDSLGGLIDYSLPQNSNFNAIKIERIITPVNKTFFALLIQYPKQVGRASCRERV